MTDGEVLAGHLSDMLGKCRAKDIITSTRFLDLAERSDAARFCSQHKADAVFFGGYDGAERTVCVFIPEYLGADMFPSYFYEYGEESPIGVLRCRYSKDAPHLSHRDFLGSLMALGVKRETIGDILVFDLYADIFAAREIIPYLLENYKKAGRVPLSTEEIALSDITLPDEKTEQHRDTVASLRLDGIIAAVFSLSRAKAEEAISAGLVFVNDENIQKPDGKVCEGDKLVLRGRGKAKLVSVGGQSKKGRTVIIFERYV